MKLRIFAILVLTLVTSSLAQTQEEGTRLMQEYMARRAEWVEIRQAALSKVKAARDEKEKKQHRDKLAEDEKPALERMAVAAAAWQAHEKSRRDQQAQGKPRN